jgi:hypothetical protein
MNNRKYILELFKGKLPFEIIIKICQFTPKLKQKYLGKPVKYKTGYRKDKLRFHIHYH